METINDILNTLDEKITEQETLGTEAQKEAAFIEEHQYSNLEKNALELQKIEEEEKTTPKTLQPETPWEEISVIDKIQPTKEEEEYEQPAISDVLVAAFKQENLIVSTLNDMAYEINSPDRIDLDFNLYDSIKGTKYEDYFSDLTHVSNADALEVMKRKIDEQLENKEIFERSGMLGFVSQLGAGIIDIDMLAGVGIISKGAKGISITKSAVKAGVITGASTALTEVGLHATQETRTEEESIAAVATATILGGALGAGAAALSKKTTGKTIEELAENFDEAIAKADERIPELENERLVPEKPANLNDELKSVGAAEVPKLKTTLEQEGLKAGKGGIAKAYAALTGWTNPITRGLRSPFKSVRELTQELFETSVYTGKVSEGIAMEPAIETLAETYRGGRAIATEINKANYKDYIKAVSEGKDVMAREAPRPFLENPEEAIAHDANLKLMREKYKDKLIETGNMSETQFDEQVSIALRNGDTHPIKHIQDTAQAYRKHVFDPLKKKAIDVGMFPEDIDVKTAESYLMRIWDKQKIIQHEEEFRAIIRPWIENAAKNSLDAFDKKTEIGMQNLFLRKDALIHKQLTAVQKAENDIRRNLNLEKMGLSHLTPEDLGFDRLGLENLPKGITVESLINLVRETKKTRARLKKKPLSLLDFIVKQGGLREEASVAGELKSRDITSKTRPDIINYKSGKTFDDMALAAQEEGYFPHKPIEGGERIDINEFLDAIDEDLSGNRVYREEDIEYTLYEKALDDMERNLNELGIDAEQFTGKELNKASEAFRKYGKDKTIGKKIFNDFIKESKKQVHDIYQKDIEKIDREIGEYGATRREDRLQKFGDIADDPDAWDEYVKEIEDNVVYTLKKLDGPTPPQFEVATRGPLANRTFEIPDDWVDGSYGGMSFLSNDIKDISNAYTSIMAADVHLFEKFGTTQFKDVIPRINREYEEFLEANPNLTPKERKKLERSRNRAIKDLQDGWELIRGSYKSSTDPDGAWARSARAMKNINYMRSMGGVTASSAPPDIAMIPFVHGFSRFWDDALKPLITNMRGLKAGSKELKTISLMTERALAGRLDTLAGLTDQYARGTVFERFLQNSANTFSKATLINHWNDFSQFIDGGVSRERIFDNLEDFAKTGKLNQTETEYMAFLGMGKTAKYGEIINNMKLVHDQFKKYGTVEEGIRIANIDQWDNKYAAEIFKTAMIKDVNRTTLKASKGDVPLAIHTAAGGVIGQFRSFALASNNKILISGLQRSDAAALQGMIFITMAGMMTYAFKTLERGEELSDDPIKWIMEGVDRGGLAAIPFEFNNALERMGVPGLYALAGDKTSSRYRSRSITGSLLGPSLGLVEKIGTTGYALSSGNMTRGDVHAMRTLVPAQNLTGIRNLFDEAEKGVANFLGIPEKRERKEK